MFIRRLDEVEPLPLKGAVEAVNPFYSPDGKWIGFWTLSGLAKIAVEGEAAVPIAKIGGPFGATWTTYDEIVLGSSGEGLCIVSANGGAPRPLTHIDSAAGAHGRDDLDVGGVLPVLGDGASPPLSVVGTACPSAKAATAASIPDLASTSSR